MRPRLPVRWAAGLAGLAVVLSLLLTWRSGSDDGRPLHVPGWELEPGLTPLLIIAGLAQVTWAVAGWRRSWWAPAALTAASIAASVVVLSVAPSYNSLEIVTGAYVALLLQAVGLLVTLVVLVEQERALLKTDTALA